MLERDRAFAQAAREWLPNAEIRHEDAARSGSLPGMTW